MKSNYFIMSIKNRCIKKIYVEEKGNIKNKSDCKNIVTVQQ